MTSERTFDALLRSWFDETAPSNQPQGLLESVVTATGHIRPRPAWLVGLRGEPMPQTGRPGLNRFAPLALAATALIVAVLIGIRALIGPPDVGPSPIPGPSHNATPVPTEQRAAAWTATEHMITAPVSDHTATVISDGKVLVVPADARRSESGAPAELYDPSSEKWIATGAMIAGRYEGYTATLLLDGRVLVTGGWNGTGRALTSAELYDPGNESWAATATLRNGRFYHTATLLPDGRVLVVGGIGSGGPLPSAELYDPLTGSWTATGSMNEARSLHTTTLLLDGKVLVIGGSSNSGSLASAELYDPRTGSWTATGSMIEARLGYVPATLLPDGRVLVVGGDSATRVVQPDVGGPGPDSLTLASAELYDPRSGSWTATGSMTEARRGHTLTLLPNGAVLVAGGYRNDSSGTRLLASAELYDPITGTWTATARMIEARSLHTATLLADGRVLAVGGADAVSPAELYDPGSGS
jgi:N-acetylneuraminic acid mutarotase